MDLNKNNLNKIEIWLAFLLVLLISMIILGGATRLTDSGLSITKWELFKGLLPPLNEKDWNKYFSLYKEIPQFKLINFDISLEEFKTIFYWEYYHRILGRLIGLVLIIPLIIFSVKKIIPNNIKSNLYLVLILVLFQGLIGWYMVMSGLTENTSVSHFRLSLHLIVAFVIFTLILWSFVNLKKKIYINFFSIRKENYLIQFFILLLFFQIVFGAFVSGLDAGKLYQTWPLMNSNFIPDDIENMFNLYNPSLVQFYHRLLAYIIFIISFFIGYRIFTRKKKLIKYYLVVFLIIMAQMILGILTLFTNVNIYIALLHQLNGLALIGSSIIFYYNYLKYDLRFDAVQQIKL